MKKRKKVSKYLQKKFILLYAYLVSEDDIFPLQETSKPPPPQRKMSRRISYMMGSVGTGQPQIYYPHLNFEPKTFFALGSPIGDNTLYFNSFNIYIYIY